MLEYFIFQATEIKSVNLFQSHSSSEFTLKHQMQFMQEQLQQMQNESELAFNQIKLIKEQLNIEIVARIDAQVRQRNDCFLNLIVWIYF